MSDNLYEITDNDSTKNIVEIIAFLASFPFNIMEAQIQEQEKQQAKGWAIEMGVWSYVLKIVAIALIINLIITIIASKFVFSWMAIHYGSLLGIFLTKLAGVLIYIGVIVIPICNLFLICYTIKFIVILYQDIIAFIYLVFWKFFIKKITFSIKFLNFHSLS